MDVPTQRFRRGLSLTQRLVISLGAGAFFVALVLGFLSATRSNQRSLERAAEAELELALALAERAAPQLERGDLMRLSVLATVARDQVQGRVLLLDRGGRVVIDTALVLGDRQLGLLAGSGPFQRATTREGTAQEAPRTQLETLVPVRFGGETIGELRVQCETVAAATTFDFTWFGLVLLSCLSLVIVAAVMGHHWSARVRCATDSLIRLSTGESGDVQTESNDGELQGLGFALQEMERGINAGLALVTDGFVGMAQQIVSNLERHRLAPAGHGVRTEQLALRLAARVRMLAADREDLALACRLVDLGKGWLRPAILQKSVEQLSPEDANSLRQHPLRAADALNTFPPLRRVAKIVRHQSERYDGAGLPDGLRGDRIPLASRILAIAAAFDLLTVSSERALSWREVLQKLDAARGEVFDPWLLDLFAEELEKEPPAVASDRQVMIIPGSSAPWTEYDDLALEDDDDEAELAQELEVMADDDEERA